MRSDGFVSQTTDGFTGRSLTYPAVRPLTETEAVGDSEGHPSGKKLLINPGTECSVHR